MFFESRYRCSSIIRWCELQRISCVSSCAQRTCPRQILASFNDTRAIKDSSGCLDNHDKLKVGSGEQRASVRQRGGERRRAGAMCSVNHKQGLRQARNHCARPTHSNRIAFPANPTTGRQAEIFGAHETPIPTWAPHARFRSE